MRTCWSIAAVIVIVVLFVLPIDSTQRFRRQDDGEAPPPVDATVDAAAADLPPELEETASDSVPSPKVPSTPSDSWVKESIQRINEIRGKHDACPLSLDKNLCIAAQARANEIVASGETKPVENENSGENVYTLKTANEDEIPKPDDAPNYWYEERNKYDYIVGKPKEEGDTADAFTQLVWKESTDVCITYSQSVGKDANGEHLTVVVAKFAPAGNVEGLFLTNVRPEEDIGTVMVNPTPFSSPKCPKAKVRASDTWLENILIAHNMLRKLHGSQALILNNDLSEISQAWANKMAETNTFEHNNDCNLAAGLGENLYFSSTSKPSNEAANGTRAVVAWYQEIENYDYETTHSKNDLEILHFTQLVWKETREMGGAYAISKKPNSRGYYSTYVVVNYSPHGNFGDFIANVKPPVCKNVNYTEIGLPIAIDAAGDDAPSGPNSNSTSLVFMNGILQVLVWMTISYYCLVFVDSLP